MATDRVSVKKFPGVFYRESSNRSHNGRPDKSFCICYDQAGRKHWKTVGWASRGVSAAYANQVRIDILNKLKLGENPALKDRKKSVTLGQAVEAYMVWAEGEGKRMRPIRSIYTVHIKKTFADLPIDLLTLDMLDKLKAELSANLSTMTVKHVFALMQRSINFAIKRKLWQGVNPVSNLGGFSMPKPDNKGERFLTPEEAAKLLDDLQERSPQWRDMALLSLHTGLRLTEVLSLHGRDIDEDSGVAIVTAKGGLREPVLLNEEALEALLRHRAGWDEPVFRNASGLPYRRSSKEFKMALIACGFNNGITDRRYRVWFHTLRHTFASWLAQSGVDIYALMKLMRHKNIEMTQRYAHLIPNQQREHLAVIRRKLQAVGLSSRSDSRP